MQAILKAPHAHKWEIIRKGFPQKICRCGALKVRGLQSGDNTVTMSPSGLDLIRFTSSNVQQKGDIGIFASSGIPQVRDGAAGLGSQHQMSRRADQTWRRAWQILQSAGTNAPLQYGIPAPTINGTPTVTQSTILEYIRYTTAAVANSDGGWITPSFVITRRDYAPVFSVSVRFQTVASCRIWLGLFSATPMASATPALSYAAFRMDSATDGTTLQCVSDNGSGVPQVTAVGGIAAGSENSYRIMLNGSVVYFCIGDSFFTQHTTKVPAAGTDLGHVTQIRTTAASAALLDISHASMNQNGPSFA